MIYAMVAVFWRRESLAAFAATLLMLCPAAAESVQGAASPRKAERPPATIEPSARAARDAPSNAGGDASPGTEPDAPGAADLTFRPLKLELPAPPAAGTDNLGTLLGRVPTASWVMGCAAGVALVVHALYQNASERRRSRMQDCGESCSEYSIDEYRETRERADMALRLSVFAAASAVWLAYNDPEEALERMGQRKLPPERRGFRVKVKPERRGVWASVVAYF